MESQLVKQGATQEQTPVLPAPLPVLMPQPWVKPTLARIALNDALADAIDFDMTGGTDFYLS